jgi:hypothetical protein
MNVNELLYFLRTVQNVSRFEFNYLFEKKTNYFYSKH